MNKDAALDIFAVSIALRLMGPDACRRLRLKLRRQVNDPSRSELGITELEDLELLLSGRREPKTTYDRVKLRNADRKRNAEPFDSDFWRLRKRDLELAGWSATESDEIISATQSQLNQTKDHNQ